MTAGKFITLEGGEGAGKSTQADALADRLRNAGHEVCVTREPGGSPLAERLRKLLLNSATPDHSPLSEAALFYAARADHLEHTIRPSLQRGTWVICDRFSDSTRAYQGAAGGVSSHVLDLLDQAIVAPTFPELTFVIDIAPDVGLDRAEKRFQERAGTSPVSEDQVRDRFERRDAAFHTALRAGFLEIAEANAERCVVIDGSKAQSDIADAIWHVVASRCLKEN